MNQGPDIASGFADVDATGAAASFVGYLDTAASLLTEHKRATVDALWLSLGDAAIDVGCGIGDEVRVIAERVGPHGRAVGVDLSEDLLAQARQRTPRRAARNSSPLMPMRCPLQTACSRVPASSARCNTWTTRARWCGKCRVWSALAGAWSRLSQTGTRSC
jgi:SAM-dependent methyltransferase